MINWKYPINLVCYYRTLLIELVYFEVVMRKLLFCMIKSKRRTCTVVVIRQSH